MKKLFTLTLSLFSLSFTILAGGGTGGGGGCSWSDSQGSATTLSVNTTYTMDNSACSASSACASPYDICSCRPCTNGDCESGGNGPAVCTISGCIGGNCGVSIENNLWGKFCPTTTGTYTYTVSNISCSGGGSSLQWAWYTTSTWACNSGAICEDVGTANTSATLSLTAGQCYTVMFDGNAAAACTFNFLIQAPLPLGVHFIDLKAAPTEGRMFVQWATASETNNAFFTVERSTDGASFTELGTVSAVGNSTTRSDYTYIDENPLTGMSYYRVKQTDTDSKFEFSPMVGVSYGDHLKFEIEKTYPSLADESVNLSVNSDEESIVTVKIFDAASALDKTFTASLQKGNNIINEDVKALKAGVYYIIIEKKGVKTLSKFIKY